MSKPTKNERIAELEKQVAIISRILCTPSDVEPELKVLDQSIFNGLDDDITYAVVKGNGEAAGFNIRPRPRGDSGFWAIDLSAKVVSLGSGYDTTDWQNSLIERDIAKELLEVDLSSELTGSDLCHEMLKRGDKAVMCKTNESNHMTIIIGYKETKAGGWVFHSHRHNNHYIVIPINNKGEPLTASEVGL